MKSSVAVQDLKLTGQSKQPVDLVAHQSEMLLEQQLPLTRSSSLGTMVVSPTLPTAKPPVGPASGDCKFMSLVTTTRMHIIKDPNTLKGHEIGPSNIDEQVNPLATKA